MVKGKFQYETHLGAGGFPFHFPFGIVFTANITPDKKTGLGDWTDGEIKRAITKGITKDGSRLMPPMPYSYFANINGEDLNAIVAYLGSMKPLPAVRKVRVKPLKQ